MSIAQPTREVAWASAAAGADIAEPSDGQKLSGWTGTPAPIYQWFNWILWKAAAWISYLRARGIADYDAVESYRVGDRVQGSDNKAYKCIQANTPSAAKDPTTQVAYWEPWESGVTDVASLVGVTGTGISKGTCRLSRNGKQTTVMMEMSGSAPNVTGAFTTSAGSAVDWPGTFTFVSVQSSLAGDSPTATFSYGAQTLSIVVWGVNLGATWTLNVMKITDSL